MRCPRQSNLVTLRETTSQGEMKRRCKWIQHSLSPQRGHFLQRASHVCGEWRWTRAILFFGKLARNSVLADENSRGPKWNLCKHVDMWARKSLRPAQQAETFQFNFKWSCPLWPLTTQLTKVSPTRPQLILRSTIRENGQIKHKSTELDKTDCQTENPANKVSSCAGTEEIVRNGIKIPDEPCPHLSTLRLVSIRDTTILSRNWIHWLENPTDGPGGPSQTREAKFSAWMWYFIWYRWNILLTQNEKGHFFPWCDKTPSQPIVFPNLNFRSCERHTWKSSETAALKNVLAFLCLVKPNCVMKCQQHSAEPTGTARNVSPKYQTTSSCTLGGSWTLAIFYFCCLFLNNQVYKKFVPKQ